MWRPKIRRQGRQRTTSGLEYSFSDRYLAWKPPRGVRRGSRREIARAMNAIPRDLGWNWARDRLIPILERPGADPMPDNPQLGAIADCGISYGFGIETEVIFTRVTRSLADLWKRDDTTIRNVALANLRRRLYDEAPRFDVPVDTGDALVVRALTTPDGCATSILLVPDVLRRVLGEHDLILTAPTRSLLLAFPIATPPESIAQLTQEAERLDPHPLLLDQFRFTGGRLTYDGSVAAVGGAAPAAMG